MRIVPEPSTARGEITLQPSYFTSSLYVEPLREDLTNLIALFTTRYTEAVQPFQLFKELWSEQGWCWLHLRTYDGRGRQAFLCVTERIFIERLLDAKPLLERVIALFALYTFHNTQPSTSAPAMYSDACIAIPIDTYEALMAIPLQLKDDPQLVRLRPYVVRVISSLSEAQAFHILPRSSLRAQNPSILPREIFVPEGQDPLAAVQASRPDNQAVTSAPPKKKGRPSKRDKARKAKEAFVSLEKYVDKNTVYLVDDSPLPRLGSAAALAATGSQMESTHVVLGQAPHTSRNNYLTKKNNLLEAVYASDIPAESEQSQTALRRANEAVYERLKQIDAMAAERGLEVGGEGGDHTGLGRIARAVEELRRSSGPGANGGILGLLEGAGLETSQ